MEAITMSVSMNNKAGGRGARGSKTQDQLVVWNGSIKNKMGNVCEGKHKY